MSEHTEKLFLIEKELKQYVPLLKQSTQTILDSDVSNYPIYVAHKEDIKLGINIIDRLKTTANWSIEASTLEEFVAKNLINSEKLEEFKKTFKDPREFVCFFLISELGAQFIFMSN